ncbi:MAG TPA: hypothetical protein VGO55_04870 [Allosphingosinicella sp.]|jgi:hypothetical protein|nr:hypothetical protein [Allosphingosinicella sp.]
MRLGERARWLIALLGVPLWLALPLIFRQGGMAKQALHRCDPTSTGPGGCPADYIPVLETMLEVVVPLFILVMLYPFARFAFSLYSPPSEGRRLKWRLGMPAGAAAAWPVLQGVAIGGAAWALWRMLTYPFVGGLWPFHIYWGAFAGWFALGALLGLLDERSASSA